MFVALFCKWLVFFDVRLSIGPMYCVFQSVQHDATCGLKPSCMKWVPSCMTWVCELSSAKRIHETAIQSAISDFHCAYVQVNLLCYHAWWRGREWLILERRHCKCRCPKSHVDSVTSCLKRIWHVIDYNADILIKKGSCQSTLDANRKLFWSVFLLSFMTPCQCVCCSCPSSTNAPCDSTCYSEGAILYRATCLDSMGGCGLEESVFLNSCQLAACQHVNHINSM